MIPFILFYLIPLCKCQSPGQAEFVINFDSPLEVCDDESAEFVDTSCVTVERYNETIAYMYGEIEFLKDVGPDTMLEVILEKETSGKYELMFSHEICDLCDEIQKGTDSDYYQYMKYFGIPDTCPFEAAKYPIKNFIVDTDQFPVNANTCGRYQAFVNFYKNPGKDCQTNKEFMYCLSLRLIIEMD